MKYTMAACRKISRDIMTIVAIIVIGHILLNIFKSTYTLISDGISGSNSIISIVTLVLNSIMLVFKGFGKKISRKVKKAKKVVKFLKKKSKKISNAIQSAYNLVISIINNIGGIVVGVAKVVIILSIIIFVVNIVLILISKFIEYEMNFFKNGILKDIEPLIDGINKLSKDPENPILQKANERTVAQLERFVKADKYEEQYQKFYKDAKILFKDKVKMEIYLADALQEYGKIKNPLENIKCIPRFVEIIKGYHNKTIKHLRKHDIISMLAAIKYFVDDDDLIKDNHILINGYKDDAKVIQYCLDDITDSLAQSLVA